MEAPRIAEVLEQLKSRMSANLGEIPESERLQTAALYVAMTRMMLIVEFGERPRTRRLFEDMLHAVCCLLVPDAKRGELMKLVDGYTKLAARDVKEVFLRRMQDGDTE